MIREDRLPQIDRHKAAIVRNDLSRPVRAALQAGLFTPGASFFDFGCGHGLDVRLLAERGYASHGWDPYYFPNQPRQSSDIVNLGYVINVIEREPERRETLQSAWALTRRVLIVAAQVLLGEPGKGQLAYGDGLVTSRNTFQKYFEQQELKNYIDSILGVDAAPAGLGIYFVFRDETQAQAFRAQRFRSCTATPRIKKQSKTFEDYRPLLDPLMRFFSERGRLPVKGELDNEAAILAEFRTFDRAFALIEQATDAQEWINLAEKRRQDLLVYIALSRFGQRPKQSNLPFDLQTDIKVFFGSYRQACETADQMLFSLGNQTTLAERCRTSHIGKFVGNALYVHVSALESLDPLLRLYEGCASRAFGQMEDATLIKFRADKPKISYLFYPDFDSDPHPALNASMQADLRGLRVDYRDYSNSTNPPVLHRKETFVAPAYPLYQKFARLTQQEEKWGLLSETTTIGTRDGWYRRLAEQGAKLQGHRLTRAEKRVHEISNPKDEIQIPCDQIEGPDSR
jgi:DNA phosphorothioation-associated putative methyltransferase